MKRIILASAGFGVVMAVSAAGMGCAVQTDDVGERTGSTASASSVNNGRDLNGRDLNGRDLNGRDLNGRDLNGRDLNGRDLNGRSLDGLGMAAASADGIRVDGRTLGRAKVDGTSLVARDSHNHKYKGDDFVGARLDGILDDGTPIPLRIDAIEQSRNHENRDLLAYTVSFRTDAGWEPYCGTDESGAPVKALPLAGRWDYRSGVAQGGDHVDDSSVFTFACDGFVLAKCVLLGYRPWEKAHGEQLAPYHQACTRMLRADYCGDGTAHTENGILINVYDDIRVQRDTESWTFEAEWTAAGARCISHARQGALPACATGLVSTHCGSLSHFDSGTLLMTEDAPPGAH